MVFIATGMEHAVGVVATASKAIFSKVEVVVAVAVVVVVGEGVVVVAAVVVVVVDVLEVEVVAWAVMTNLP